MSATFKLPAGGAQAVLTMTGPADLEARMIALWVGHAEWMKRRRGLSLITVY